MTEANVEYKKPTDSPGVSDPSARGVVAALALCLVFVALTRLPLARTTATDFDEVGYLETIQHHLMPMHHTLFLALGRLIGAGVDDPYRGFVLLDVVVSALALVAVWWWLRALTGPKTSASATLALGCGPVFWGYGAMAANYTAIPLVGSILLGIAYRGRNTPKPWHPYVSALILALGTGYRQDIGTFWLPIFLVILWRHRWLAALQAGLLFTALNLAWLVPMLHDAGGWQAYREASAEFAHSAGYMNSVWHVGLIDGPLRYAVKGAMALLWTLGPGLLLVPVGLVRLRRIDGGAFLAGLLALSVLPSLGSHLLVHFGVPGYAFHYVPALMGLMVLAIGPPGVPDRVGAAVFPGLAAILAAVFLLYPTDYDHPGFRGSFDLAFARHTRIGLRTPSPVRDPVFWRTVNSQELPGESGRRTVHPRQTLSDLLEGTPPTGNDPP
ncbi:MAG: hypothetical protein ABI353_05625 [Isosphaeraceae bacterium]